MISEAKLQRIYLEYAFDEDTRIKAYRGKNFVMGNGPIPADVMFVGEAPGHDEDINGIPFCGVSGERLDSELARIGTNRRVVFVTNVFKYRPPGNRTPNSFEVSWGAKLLTHEVSCVNPRLIVCLGKVARNVILQGYDYNKIRGKIMRKGRRMIIATDHPAASLYAGSSSLKALQSDFDVIGEVIGNEFLL